MEQHKNFEFNTKILRTTQKFGRLRAVSRLGELYRGICLTTEEKTRKNLSHAVAYNLAKGKEGLEI
jgi:hypothetical protein